MVRWLVLPQGALFSSMKKKSIAHLRHFKVCLFIWKEGERERARTLAQVGEGQRARERERERERERQRIPSRLRAVSLEPDAGLELLNGETMT